MRITNGSELRDWLYDDAAYDYYEDEIIRGYSINCGVHDGRDFDEDEDYEVDESISLEDTNGIDDLDEETRSEYDDTVDPIIKLVEANIDLCTEHIKNRTIRKYLEDNVQLGDDGSSSFFDYILDRIDNII